MEEKESDDVVHETVSCPVCGNWVKSIFAHLGKSKQCKQNISPEDLLNFENIRSLKRKLQKREAAANLRKSNPEKSRQEKREAAANFRKSNPEKANEEAKKGMAKIRKLNPEKAKEQARKGMAKMRELDPEKAKQQRREGMAKSRARPRTETEAEAERLHNFRVDTLYGPVFVCVSCHQRQFQSNVQIFNETVREKISKKISLEKCIADLKLTSGPVKKGDDGPKQWICKTCLNSYLLKGKLPSFSVMNGLKLNETTEERKEKGIDLTEFEGSLVSKKLMFQKIFLLPGSRWAGTMDKQILIPVQTDKIQNLLGQLPRTPTEAGLIGVNLKRKKEYKGAHKSQLINPQKLFNFIATCKAAGHPLYQDVSTRDMDDFEEKCKKSTNDHRLVFGDDSSDDDDTSVESLDNPPEEEDSDRNSNDDTEDDSNWGSYYSNDDSEASDDNEEDDVDSEEDSDVEDDNKEDDDAKIIRKKRTKILNDKNVLKHLRNLGEKFPSEAKLRNFELLLIELSEDEEVEKEGEDDPHQTKYDLWDRCYFNISITVIKGLLDIVEEFAEHDLLNTILDEAYQLMTENAEQYLINLWKQLFIVGQHFKAIVQKQDGNDEESLEELKEKEMSLREKFKEQMGTDPVDPYPLIDMLKMDPAIVKDLIRWAPPRAFSKHWILQMQIFEHYEDWCNEYNAMINDDGSVFMESK